MKRDLDKNNKITLFSFLERCLYNIEESIRIEAAEVL